MEIDNLIKLILQNKNKFKKQGPKVSSERMGVDYKTFKFCYDKAINHKFNMDNVLVISDLHEPFCLKKSIEFCKQTQIKYDCGTVVFIGDIIDNHYSSYHETEQNALGGDDEFELSLYKIKKWYEAFPLAYVTIGNHDRLVNRKAKTGNIPKKWIKNYKEVLETPGWNFVDEIVINDVNYNHGEAGTAKTKMKNELQSQVQGHLHSQFYIEYSVGNRHKVFGMQVGCLIDRHSYAMAYAKNSKKPVIGCGVVLNKGTLPILIPMEL